MKLRSIMRINPEQMVLVAGWADTRAALSRWNAHPWRVLLGWMRVSCAVGGLLLAATWAVASLHEIPEVPKIFGAGHAPSTASALHIFGRNLLVLIMHALICIAGYMGAASVPIASDAYSGWVRRLHLLATPLAFGFIIVVTCMSFMLQALSLGRSAAMVAHHYDIPVAELLVLLAPHALPELTAMFLPLGAWLVLARQRAYRDLFAASIITTAVAVPMLAVSALIEVYVSPRIFAALT